MNDIKVETLEETRKIRYTFGGVCIDLEEDLSKDEHKVPLTFSGDDWCELYLEKNKLEEYGMLLIELSKRYYNEEEFEKASEEWEVSKLKKEK